MSGDRRRSAAYPGGVSIHIGIVVANIDPSGLGRLQVTVPAVSPEPLGWAITATPIGVASRPSPPEVGATVLVGFVDGDTSSPVVLGSVQTGPDA